MKPILFNTEMVRSILDGRKTVTRRIAKNINPNICCQCEGEFDHDFIRDDFIKDSKFTGYVCRKCGYGVSPPHTRYSVGTSFIKPPYQIGDILYVRETWKRCLPSGKYIYKADEIYGSNSWCPSIHMPREAARIFLRVTDVRAERLRDISLYDLWDEGTPQMPQNNDIDGAVSHEDFAYYWDNIINPKDRALYGWNVNPWVWVIRFERISREEAENESIKSI